MMTKNLLLLIAVICLLATPAFTAYAQDENAAENLVCNSGDVFGPNEKPDHYDLLVRIDSAYQEARKKLNIEQIAYLDTLDRKEREMLELDVEVITMASVLKECIDFNNEIRAKSAEYQAAFDRVKELKKTRKHALARELEQLKNKATFISERILNEHLQAVSLERMNDIAQDAALQLGTKSCDDLKAMLSEHHLLPGGRTLVDSPFP